MADKDDKIPEYLKNSPFENGANFGPEDTVWSGKDGDLDPDALVREKGWEHRDLLYQVIRALIAGYQPDLLDHELDSQTQRIKSEVLGDVKKRGNSEDDDSPLLLEIAFRYHAALHEQGKWPSGSVPLKPIVRSVVSEHGKSHRGAKMPTEESLVDTLVRKFKEERDLWLARATTDDPYYSPDRMDDIRKLKQGLRLLGEAGVNVDLKKIKPSSRPK